MFWDFWKNRTDCSVCGPKIPSGMMLRRSWSCLTTEPFELSFNVFMLLFLIGLRDEISQQLSFRVFIEKLFYNFWDECNSSLLAFVFCGCWKRDEIEPPKQVRDSSHWLISFCPWWTQEMR